MKSRSRITRAETRMALCRYGILVDKLTWLWVMAHKIRCSLGCQNFAIRIQHARKPVGASATGIVTFSPSISILVSRWLTSIATRWRSLIACKSSSLARWWSQTMNRHQHNRRTCGTPFSLFSKILIQAIAVITHHLVFISKTAILKWYNLSIAASVKLSIAAYIALIKSTGSAQSLQSSALVTRLPQAFHPWQRWYGLQSFKSNGQKSVIGNSSVNKHQH